MAGNLKPRLPHIFSITVLLLTLCVSATGESQPRKVSRFQHLSVEDGLSQDVVQSIVQDDDGFIWLGTQHGLNRFDGFQFEVYPLQPDGPADEWVRTLLVDRSGTVWAGADGGLLAAKARDADAFEPVSYLTEPAPDTGGVNVRELTEDGHGNIWVATDGGGVTRIAPRAQEYTSFRSVDAEAHGLPSDAIKAVHADQAGRVWVGTEEGGVYRYYPDQERFRMLPMPAPNLSVRAIASQNDTLWVGTKEDGLLQYDVRADTWIHHKAGDAPGTLASNAIRVLFVDEAGQLWAGHDTEGLDRYSNGRFENSRNAPGNPLSLANDHVTAIFQDAGRVLWVGTMKGTSRWNPEAAVFTNVSTSSEGLRIRKNWVSSFAQLDDDRYWVGTAGGGASEVNFATGEVRTLLHDPEDANSLSDNRVFALVPDGRDLWIGTRGSGLDRYNEDTGLWQNYHHAPDDAHSLSFNGVTSLLKHSDGTLWVGTYLGGLNRYRPSTDDFEHLRQEDGDPLSLCYDRVLSLDEDSRGTIWVGTHGGGLCSLDPAGGVFRTYRHDPDNPYSLSSDNAWLVTEDHAGNLWIGTADAGLNVWVASDRAQGRARFHRFDQADGLPSRVIYGLAVDSDGHVWASSNRGITRIRLDPTDLSLQIRHLRKSDGLPDSEFNFAAALAAADGRLMFGGTSGFTTFYPRDLTSSRYDARINLTGIYGADGGALAETKGSFVLDHEQPVVTFEYAAMDYVAPKTILYERKLEGFDEAWIADGNRHRATYTNLAAGDYVLRVRTSNRDGVRSPHELTYNFRAEPPPWRTPWAYQFYLVIALLTLTLLARAWRRRTAMAKRITEVNESLFSEITERMEKERALEQERATAQRYLDVVEVIMIALDPAGRITMINPKGLRVLATTEQDALGRDFCATFVPEDQREEVRRRLDSPERYRYSEWRLKTPNGADRLIAWQSIQLPSDPDGGGLLISGTDVTQVRDLESQLRDAQKMEALGTLARGVAHDFNNILSAIIGYTELSQKEIARDHAAQTHLSDLSASVARARDLIQRILTFGRVAARHPRTVMVSEAIADAIQLVRPVLPREARLKTELDENCGKVLADPSQLVQIVLNLCTNAAQSMSGEGCELTIRLKNRRVGEDEAQTLSLPRTGSYACLSVIDSGPGMDSYTLSRIFEPFFTTREQGEGTGLGLSVVHGIVGSLNGAITVTSEVGSGTRFDVYLPNLQAEGTTEISRISVEEELPEGAETVLFVDDEPAIAHIARRSLGLLGYTVHAAGGGEEALGFLEEHGAAIDIVVTDQTMPGMLGEDLAQAVKARYPDMLVVLTSGADHPTSPHVDAFIPKPFSTEQLATSIRKTIRSREAA